LSFYVALDQRSVRRVAQKKVMLLRTTCCKSFFLEYNSKRGGVLPDDRESVGSQIKGRTGTRIKKLGLLPGSNLLKVSN
jgi:hypothetical protein